MIAGTKHPQIAPTLIDTHAHLANVQGQLFHKVSRMFVLSKLFGIVSSPLNLLLLALVALTALGYSRWRRWQRPLLAVLTALLLVIAVAPVDALLVRPLEERFPQPHLPERVDGVVVLGGALDPVLSVARDQVAASGAVERITALIQLGRRYPGARLVFTGGTGSLSMPDDKEAPVVRRFLAEQGFDADRVTFEAESRNTRENALFTKQLMRPAAGETWLLVTSALHMPRSVGIFNAVDWPVLAYPVDYLSSGREGGLGFSLAGALGRIDAALHEWFGLLYYRARGWTDRLFPSP